MGATMIGMLVFPDVTQLDVSGPFEAFARMPGASVVLLGSGGAAVRSDRGLTLGPVVPLAQAPPLDVLCAPGGPGVSAAMEDPALVGFLRDRGERVRYVTSVCTGALLLGAAGLLRGYRATTHWLSLELLPYFGATPVAERVVVDRNRITGAGVTAGIDLALVLAARLCGEEIAREIQLALEYDPAPPFDSGAPRIADPELVARVRASRREQQDARREQARRIGGALG